MNVWMITLEEKYCKAILEGRKKFELRTRIPKDLAASDAILVCKKGSKGLVPFFFLVDAISICSPQIMWSLNHRRLAIDVKDYLEYTKGKSRVYGLRIGYMYRYDHEMNISDFWVQKPPRWFTQVFL